VPKFIYTCKCPTDQLLITNLITGEQSWLRIPGYQFKDYCRWSELPGGGLLITGGVDCGLSVGEVVRIDTQREFAVISLSPMHTARQGHAEVYHSQYLYVLGGLSYYSYLSECERYLCAESRWEVLPALPVACSAMSAVVLDNSLYALGGSDDRILDTVQQLSLDSLTWQLMQLKLPQACYFIACFKTESQVYLVIKKTLYSFTPFILKPIKTVPQAIKCYSSYYSRGTLYYSDYQGIKSLAVGELTRVLGC
jgi:hypothetical protein